MSSASGLLAAPQWRRGVVPVAALQASCAHRAVAAGRARRPPRSAPGGRGEPREGQRVCPIKLYRDATGATLAEALDAIQRIARGPRGGPEPIFPPLESRERPSREGG